MEPLDSSRRPQIEPLLATAANAARNEHFSIARTLYRGIVREFPADPRGWRGLADMAADPAEVYSALQQLVALQPEDAEAREQLDLLAEQLGYSPTPTPPQSLPAEHEAPQVLVDDPQPDPTDTPVVERRRLVSQDPAPEAAPRFPLMNRIALATILLLLLLIGVLIGRAVFVRDAPPPMPLTLVPLVAPTELPDPNPTVSVATPAALTTTLPVATPQALEPSVAAAPAALPEDDAPLPLGAIAQVDAWSATLLRPEYALLFDGGIADLQPSGRFVLALVAISNDAALARRIPDDLFTIVDQQGRRFLPLPGASTSFLNEFGRGQYGDLALEDDIAAESGLRTVPLIFDVPTDASGLILEFGDSGWPIEGAVVNPAGP